MKWMRMAATVLAAASMGLAASAATAQNTSTCRNACNTSYQACVRAKTNETTCLRRWNQCKKQCAPATKRTPTTTQTPAPAPKKKG